MSKSVRVFLITMLSFGIYFIFDDLVFTNHRIWINGFIIQLGISHIITYTVTGLPIALGAVYIHKLKGVINSFGLAKSFKIGALFAFICTMPMLTGYIIFFDFSMKITLDRMLISVFSAAFFEELYFRGFLFGQLYRYTNLGFIPSVAIGALLFASLHVYQSDDLSILAGIFATTLLGAVLFAWAYSEWDHNLWVPIFLHLFMNLYWLIFSAGDNALGGINSNIFRIITIVSIIVFTIVYKRKKGIGLEITRQSLWMKSKSEL